MRYAGTSGCWDLSSLNHLSWRETCLPSASRSHSEGPHKVLTMCTELLERWVCLVFESPGPEVWVASSHTSQDLFSSSYLYLFLNILGKS